MPRESNGRFFTPVKPDDHNHPAAAVVEAFGAMREACRHYHGIKMTDDEHQCTHPENELCGHWCAMDACPLLRDRAREFSLGWD